MKVNTRVALGVHGVDGEPLLVDFACAQLHLERLVVGVRLLLSRSTYLALAFRQLIGPRHVERCLACFCRCRLSSFALR